LHKNHAHLHFLAMCVTYCIWTAVAYAIAVEQAHDLDYPGAAPSHIAGRCTVTLARGDNWESAGGKMRNISNR